VVLERPHLANHSPLEEVKGESSELCLSSQYSSAFKSRPSFAQNRTGYPMRPKTGYYTEPLFEILSAMPVEECKRIPNFVIGNEFGSIEFFGETDLTGVNLAELVTIRHKEAEVYPAETLKPSFGAKLNKAALITLYDIKPKKGQSPEDKEAHLR